ncbi:MAG: NAD(P)-binding domain-containing protein [Acuticoccus sp.]
MRDLSLLPVVVVGAGPVGLAAAARLVERGLPFMVLEQGAAVAAAPRAWGHVRLFTPWRYAIDAAAERLLEAESWRAPDPETLPTGAELVDRYLAPLARHGAIAPHLVLGARVTAIGRAGLGKMSSDGREDTPFMVRWTDGAGAVHRTAARAVLDASGTYGRPNPIGVDGLMVEGEAAAGERIEAGLPDVLGSARAAYAGGRILVVGSGHSAINVVLDLVRLREEVPGTRIVWALRRGGVERLVGGGRDDQLRERGALGLRARAAIEAGAVTLLAPLSVERIARTPDGLAVDTRMGDTPRRLDVDRIVVATGFRPDLDILREVRVALDPVVEATPMLAPLIDPNLHSCGTVRPHGAVELAHPERDFYIVGAKSYGRAPTFLMTTGYEQVRSVVAEIAGDHAAAREVRLVLPETGVCNVPPAEAVAGCCGTPAVPADDGCCDGPAPTGDTCCAADAAARARGEGGCGCAAPAVTEAV